MDALPFGDGTLDAIWSEGAIYKMGFAAGVEAWRKFLKPGGYFPLPETCRLDNHYRPLQRRFPAFLDRHGHSGAATAIVEAEENEISLYERHSAFVSYGYYIARKTG